MQTILGLGYTFSTTWEPVKIKLPEINKQMDPFQMLLPGPDVCKGKNRYIKAKISCTNTALPGYHKF